MDDLIAQIETPRGMLMHATVEEALASGASQQNVEAAMADASWQGLRDERARRLTACDWTMMLDAPLTTAQKAAWKEYRTALRNLPATVLAAKLSPSDALAAPAIWPIQPTI